MSDALLAALFLVSGLVSLLFSWLLVTAIERVGARLALTEGLLGMLAALAADAPEITAAVAALAGHHSRIGTGVVIGSNVFNLAALLGLAAVLAGRIARLRLPAAWTGWLSAAVEEEELELEVAIHPRRGGARDAALAALAVLVVVGASVAMERTAAELGTRHAVPEIVTGALVLAAVTSLPNAVAASYLAARGRGAAVLSTALNSNAINVLAGLLLPATLVGLGTPSGQTTFVAASYVGLTAVTLVSAYATSGLRRAPGALVIAAYLAFVAVLLANS